MSDCRLSTMTSQKPDGFQSETDWVFCRLREEANCRAAGSSHASRIRALELTARLLGLFKLDNRQKADPLKELLSSLRRKAALPIAPNTSFRGEKHE